MSDELEGICERLKSIAEELDDLVMSYLRDALGEGQGARDASLEEERRLHRARRSVEKALHVLRPMTPDEE